MKFSEITESFENDKHRSKADERELAHEKINSLAKEHEHLKHVLTNLRDNEYPKYLSQYFANNPGAAESGFMNSAEGKEYDLKSRALNDKINNVLSRLSIARTISANLSGEI